MCRQQANKTTCDPSKLPNVKDSDPH
uniref:Uncharacterized protein n=1 Tax=Rhizophora mucronata TaxID=61149 RepID=A0A2P2Q5T8_RHIMU